MVLEIPITGRARKYGYIFWSAVQDSEVEKFFGKVTNIDLWFENSYLGKMRIDWQHRRISVGWSRTRPLGANINTYNLKFNKDGSLRVVCG